MNWALYQFLEGPFGVTNDVAAFKRIINIIIYKEDLERTYAYLDNVTICGSNQKEHDLNLHWFLEVSRKYKLTIDEEISRFSIAYIILFGYTI